MLKNRRCISPVVSMSLLIVVCVVAVVSFQSWFGTYQSSIFADAEIKSNQGINVEIVDVIDREIYIKNNGDKDLMITTMKVDGIQCNTGKASGTPTPYAYPQFINRTTVTAIKLSECILNLESGKRSLFIEIVDGFYNSSSIYYENGSKSILPDYIFYQNKNFIMSEICQGAILGDANCDGEVTTDDMFMIQKIMVGDYDEHTAADCNLDFVITSSDILCIRNIIFP